MKYNAKKRLILILAVTAFLGSFGVVSSKTAWAAENDHVKNAEQEILLQDASTAYSSEDLKFLSLCDLDELRVWDDSLGTFTEAQQQEVKAFMEANILKSGMSDYEKAQAIFQWIAANIQYAGSTDVISVDPYAVFKNKIAVCGGYSNLYKAMLNLENIPAVLMIGNTTSGAHAWNAVYADGRWFYGDSTWACSDGMKWFDMSASEFLQSHGTTRIEGASVWADPVILGYDGGISVIGAKEGVKNLTVPDAVQNIKLTRISYQLFHGKYGIQILNLGKNVEWIDVQQSSNTLEAISVSKENPYYASEEGVLYNKDQSSILLYPAGKKDSTFLIPKETTGIDLKEIFGNTYLQEFQVESGNSSYAAEEGLLYDHDKTTLLCVPAGKSAVRILGNAVIDEMAFINTDLSQVTIYAEEGSLAHQYAVANQISFVSISKQEEKNPFVDVLESNYYYRPVLWAAKEGITQGCSETEFCPKESCTRAQVVTFLWRAAGCPKPKSNANPFRDVKESTHKYSYQAILWAVENQITTGYTDGTFRPDREVTRAEFVTFQYRAAGKPELKNHSNPFPDIYDRHINYKNAILWAVENQITTGNTDGTFAPDRICSRADVVTFLYRGALL